MTKLVFETPGLIDLRSFTTMGLSSKPNTSNPIGLFGTGLKYAIAVLVRLGAEPELFVGRDRYVFQKRTETFRGKEFDQLRMRCEKFRLTRARYVDLPFTTEYGRFWQPWMVVRELEANTRDENGQSFLFEHEIVGEDNITRIVVEQDDVIEAYRKLDEIFLPGAQRDGEGVQVIRQPSEFLYWRGLRVYKTQKPCQFTYNFLDGITTWITEDRTLQAEYFAKSALAEFLLKCEDDELIEQILTSDEAQWEHSLDFPDNVAPSAAFHKVMLRRPKGLISGAWGYYPRWDERVTERTFDPFEAHPLPWKLHGNTVVDAADRAIFEAPYKYAGKWELIAEMLLRKVNPPTAEEEEAARLEPEIPEVAPPGVAR